MYNHNNTYAVLRCVRLLFWLSTKLPIRHRSCWYRTHSLFNLVIDHADIERTHFSILSLSHLLHLMLTDHQTVKHT